MSSTKVALKAAKAALDAKNFHEVIAQSRMVLAADEQNYFAKLFLAFAQEKLGKPNEAIESYKSATEIRPNDDQAWQGLRNVYESEGLTHVDQCIAAATKLAQVYIQADDQNKCQSTIDRLISFVEKFGTKVQNRRVLEIQLPTSAIYTFLEGRMPHPSQTYTRIAELLEAEEKAQINNEIGERRTRLGARIGQITVEVQREVFANSELEDVYQNVINWAMDDDHRRVYEEKLLQRAYDTLLVLPQGQKSKKRMAVLELAEGMVIINHPFLLAWNISMEWKDFDAIARIDPNFLREYAKFFPENGLAKLLTAFLCSDVSPFKLSRQTESAEDEGSKDTPTEEQIFIKMAEAFEEAEASPFAHRLMAELFLRTQEYEDTINTARKGLQLLAVESHKTDLTFAENKNAFELGLATALIYFQTPRHHLEARSLFRKVLENTPLNTTALIGLGLILEEEEAYVDALRFFNDALENDSGNLRIAAEAAWCKALSGDFTIALEELDTFVLEMTTENQQCRELRAKTLHRIGICHWELKPSKAERRDRSGAYSYFLAAIRTDPLFAPAYTSLGLFYAEYAKDRKRAQQCFQKAFELSSTEVEAAENLAHLFADQGEWDIVEVIAQRVVDSGIVNPPPGSKKKGVSWPFSALGVVQINKQEYRNSMVSFLSALRIDPSDYCSFVGLGESYHNSGRYNSAAKALQNAEKLGGLIPSNKIQDRWFTKYMLANVKRELGQYDAAIRAYQEVLIERDYEYGVAIALSQTYVEQSWQYMKTSFFGRAASTARSAITIAAVIASKHPQSFNLWKAVGDACAIFVYVQKYVNLAPIGEIIELLKVDFDTTEFKLYAEFDGVGDIDLAIDGEFESSPPLLIELLLAAILASKRAIVVSANETHGQAIAWYNLGWSEWRAFLCLKHEQKSLKFGKLSGPMRFASTAIRCFKRAIELEGGNAEFWNALGIVTASLSPKVSQHAFVRSLHLNERNAHVWTNLGALCLLQEDSEMAHTAFSRAQSTDPDQANAWLGEGLIALRFGDKREAALHFAHAFELSDSSSLVAKRQYVLSTFDILSRSKPGTSGNDILQPLHALQQLRALVYGDWPFDQLRGLYLERAGKFNVAVHDLSLLCEMAEKEHESSESAVSLSRFVQAKSDLARCKLAIGEFEQAVVDSQTVLDLTLTDATEDLGGAKLRAIRVSAQLTSGLASYFMEDMDASISMFRSTLQITGSDPDVVCLLATVLWAKGGDMEKEVAKDQLFSCIERSTDHIEAINLLGAIAVVEEDDETIEAVRDELMNMRIKEGLDTKIQRRTEIILDAITTLSRKHKIAEEEIVDGELLAEITTSILLSPDLPHGWAQLAAVTEKRYAGEMALKTAERAIPPHGPLDVEDMARAFIVAGTVADVQRAIMLTPAGGECWAALEEALIVAS